MSSQLPCGLKLKGYQLIHELLAPGASQAVLVELNAGNPMKLLMLPLVLEATTRQRGSGWLTATGPLPAALRPVLISIEVVADAGQLCDQAIAGPASTIMSARIKVLIRDDFF